MRTVHPDTLSVRNEPRSPAASPQGPGGISHSGCGCQLNHADQVAVRILKPRGARPRRAAVLSNPYRGGRLTRSVTYSMSISGDRQSASRMTSPSATRGHPLGRTCAATGAGAGPRCRSILAVPLIPSSACIVRAGNVMGSIHSTGIWTIRPCCLGREKGSNV